MCRRSSYSRLDCKNIVTDWRQVVWQHGHIVWQMAYRLLGNHADAPDCFQNDHLRLALTRLPDGQAEAFCLRWIEGMSYEEISERLEIEPNHVGVLLNRARKRLRQLLDRFVSPENVNQEYSP